MRAFLHERTPVRFVALLAAVSGAAERKLNEQTTTSKSVLVKQSV